jgi:NTE family protein
MTLGLTQGFTLVLGGGGVAGIAWMTGLLAGLADGGQDLTDADLIIGTSAGATVAAQVGSGLGVAELYRRQTEPELQAREISVELNLEEFATTFSAVFEGATSIEEIRRRTGKFALAAETPSEALRREVIAGRLPSHDWPERRLLLLAIDAEAGEPREFRNDSGVDLIDAVAASCAVPGVWSPVTIEGRRYYDGGMPSADNADYAAGAERIVIIAPLGTEAVLPGAKPFDEVVGSLREGGAEVTVISPDEDSWAAFGTNPLDPATRAPAAEAGRAQGLSLSLSRT